MSIFQGVVTFSAGLLAGQGLGACQESLPGCRLRDPAQESGSAFRLSVRVLGADSPELQAPGLVARPVLRLEVGLGESQKETEAAVFAGGQAGGSSSSGAKASSWAQLGCVSSEDRASRASSRVSSKSEEDEEACSWHFDDTLTFAARVPDLLGPGLRLRLGACSDVCIGPLQVRMPRVQDLGEAVLELRHGILAACRLAPTEVQGGSTCSAGGSIGGAVRQVWQTPVLQVSLKRLADGMRTVVVARVALTCSVTADPALLLHEAARAERSLVDRVVDPFVRCIETPACGGAPFCCSAAVGRGAATARSPRTCCSVDGSAVPVPFYRGAGSSGSRGSEGQCDSAYATCEVPSSLVSGGPPLQEDLDGLSGLNGLNGLWPMPPSGHRAGAALAAPPSGGAPPPGFGGGGGAGVHAELALGGWWPSQPPAEEPRGAGSAPAGWQPRRFWEPSPQDVVRADGGGRGCGEGITATPPRGEHLYTMGLNRPSARAPSSPPVGVTGRARG